MESDRTFVHDDEHFAALQRRVLDGRELLAETIQGGTSSPPPKRRNKLMPDQNAVVRPAPDGVDNNDHQIDRDPLSRPRLMAFRVSLRTTATMDSTNASCVKEALIPCSNVQSSRSLRKRIDSIKFTRTSDASIAVRNICPKIAKRPKDVRIQTARFGQNIAQFCMVVFVGAKI